jgi:hypothetical protein
MVRKLSLLFVTIFISVAYSFSQNGTGEITGFVFDAINKSEGVFDAKIIVKSGTETKYIGKTDFNGKYRLSGIQPGSYDIFVTQNLEGYEPTGLTGVTISSDKINSLEPFFLEKAKVQKPISNTTTISNTEKPSSKKNNGEKELDAAKIKTKKYVRPLIDKDGGASGDSKGAGEIKEMAVRDVAGVVGTMAGVNNSTGEMSLRGGAGDATIAFIDGQKVRGGLNLPKGAFEEISVMTGGIPASYGDATGGIISVTTKGPTSNYFGNAEIVSSGIYFKGKDAIGYDGKVFGFDKYGYNLFEGMLSGPLLFKRDSLGNKEKPILGFLISANYTNQLDSRPLANGGGFRVKKEVRDEILANPLRAQPDGKVPLHATNFLRANDFERNPWRMNAATSTFTSTAKIDVKTGPTINLTFGSTFNYNFGKQYSYTSSLLNFANNGDYNSSDFRVYGRFTQRFDNSKDPKALIKSASYSLMVDYSSSTSANYDGRFKYNAFEYGHIGSFATTQVPSYRMNYTTLTASQDGFRDEKVDFTPSKSNNALAAITSQYYSIYANSPQGHYENLNQIQQGNALINGDSPANVYDLWSNIGSPYNYMGKSQAEQFRVTGNGNVLIGGHKITLGFEFEQRFDRSWGCSSPMNLWFLARKYTNSHISELDYTTGDTVNMGNYDQVTFQRLNSGYAYKHNGVFGGQKAQKDFSNGVVGSSPENQYFFDYNLRNNEDLKLPGKGANSTYIDVNRLDPRLLTIDMFSADELLNNGNSYISYYGYDKAGNKTYGKTDINDYFNTFDEPGNYQRAIGAFQPIYVAGYIMDKFSINDLLFNVGLRIDAFDANQPVLKDPYLLFNANTVAEAKEKYSKFPTTHTWLADDNKQLAIPSSMGDNYVVYVNDVNNPTTINGYRSGSTWYNAQGIPVDNPKVLEGPGGIAPWLTFPKVKTINETAFELYKPQINFMPRFSFSFPISHQALFFAHYDILTKRPSSANRFDPTDYQFLALVSSPTISNPNLKPETTIDYELGFQQVLTKTSSIKISAYYREQRNQVQLVNMFDAYPKSYKTYGNRDFGTVKGLTIAYDLRRTGNLRMTANYTLQFAEGTGTDAASIASFIQAGLPNLRNIFPYDYDTRHQFNFVTDYRYGEGAAYNGPEIGGIKLFENVGLNITTNIFSGNPYSSQSTITNAAALSPLASGLTGTLNGSRKPWSYRLDMQLDKNIQFTIKDKSANASDPNLNKDKKVFLNIYIRATNLFNQFNVVNVYRATGNWNDDGYLAAAQFQQSIQNQYDEKSFRDYYTMKVQNAFNISAPRNIRLGVRFDF